MNISIIDCGATANTDTLQTMFIQNAIDKCFLAGGGEVIVPEGIFKTGGIRLRSNVTFRLLKGAKIVASRDINDYQVYYKHDELNPIPEDVLPVTHTAEIFKRVDCRRWFTALIQAYNEKNIAIIGEEGSLIDGQNCYDPDGEEDFRGPHCVFFIKTENVKFKGYTIENSSNWAHGFWSCKNISCEEITVLGGHDGIHFMCSDDIEVKKCKLFTGDDCIAGLDLNNMRVQECELNSACHAFRLSGTHIRVSNCHAFGPGYYAWRGSLTKEEQKEGVVATPNEDRYNLFRGFYTYYSEKDIPIREQPCDMVFTDCVVENPLRFVSYTYSTAEIWSSGVPLKDISFKNIQASNVYVPLYFFADDTACDGRLYMENCQITFLEDRKANAAFKVGYFNKIYLKDITTNCACDTKIACYGPKNGEIQIEGGNIGEDLKIGEFTRAQFRTTFV